MKIKSKFLLYVVIPLFSIFVSSCNEDSEYYSCEKNVDRWVKDNFKEVRGMTRADWAEIGDIVYQRAVYNAFSPEQRFNLWMEKFERLPEMFSKDAEKAHIELLISALRTNPHWFSDIRTDEEKNQFELFFYRWREYASSDLGWTPDKIYTLVGTPENVEKTGAGEIIVKTTRNIGKIRLKTRSENGGGYGNVCDCGDDSKYWACSVLGGASCKIDYNNPCRQTEHGCGFLWQDACWGICKS